MKYLPRATNVRELLDAAGITDRDQVEKLITAGRVRFNGTVLHDTHSGIAAKEPVILEVGNQQFTYRPATLTRKRSKCRC